MWWDRHRRIVRAHWDADRLSWLDSEDQVRTDGVASGPDVIQALAKLAQEQRVRVHLSLGLRLARPGVAQSIAGVSDRGEAEVALTAALRRSADIGNDEACVLRTWPPTGSTWCYAALNSALAATIAAEQRGWLASVKPWWSHIKLADGWKAAPGQGVRLLVQDVGAACAIDWSTTGEVVACQFAPHTGSEASTDRAVRRWIMQAPGRVMRAKLDLVKLLRMGTSPADGALEVEA